MIALFSGKPSDDPKRQCKVGGNLSLVFAIREHKAIQGKQLPMTDTIPSTVSANSVLFLGHNGEFWDFWLILSVIIAAFGGIAVCVTTTGSVVAHKREAEAATLDLDKYKVTAKLESDVAIGDARAEAEVKIEAAKNDTIIAIEAARAEAKTRTDILENETAKARERASQLEKEAEEAKLAQKKIEDAVKWRVFDQNQLDILVREIGKHRGSVTIGWIANDPESMFVGAQIEYIFKAINEKNNDAWQITYDARTYTDRLWFGIFIPPLKEPATTEVRDAFTLAGIPFSPEAIPYPVAKVNSIMVSGDNPTTDLFIMAGSKRPRT
jgi:hypothetical protein